MAIKKKPSKDKERLWIKTKSQLTEAPPLSFFEKKQREFNYEEVIELLRKKGYKAPIFQFDSRQRIVLVDRKTSKPLELNETLIDEIAERTSVLAGKWLIYIQREYVDELWAKIEKLANEGKIWRAKITTRAHLHPWASRGGHLICIYTKNYLDKQDVMRVREILREIGVESRLSYKPDIYTHLGIYSNNKKSFNLNRVARYIS